MPIREEGRAEGLRFRERQPVLAGDGVLPQGQNVFGQIRQRRERQPRDRPRIPVGHQFAGGEPHVAAEAHQRQRLVTGAPFGKILQRAVDLLLHHVAQPSGRGPQVAERLPQSQRAEPERMRVGDVPAVDPQNFRAAAADFRDDQPHCPQQFILL